MKINKNTALKVIGAITMAGLLTAGASSCSDVDASSTTQDQETTEQILKDLQKAQPVPKFPYSQYRENLIEIVTAQAVSTPTTTFFFNQGVKDPIATCASVGFPIASTSQLTNPDKIVDRYEGDVTIAQVEPTGVYTGDSSGTYVICRDANGRAYGDYWEGNVKTVTGPAEWDGNKIVLIGAPTGEFSTGE